MKHYLVLIFAGLLVMAACESDSGSAATGDTTGTDSADMSTGTDGTDSIDMADGNESADGDDSAEGGDDAWGVICTEDTDCAAPTDLCVKQPGATEGYCSISCPNLGADCTYSDWTCNVVGECTSPLATWCGPPDEPEATGGVVKACP
ncbi:MAG: hypothetical protein VX223_17055 [Myxococcota bacterium]|nr:hypothetical protein [Myxococcota bacterium]